MVRITVEAETAREAAEALAALAGRHRASNDELAKAIVGAESGFVDFVSDYIKGGSTTRDRTGEEK
ncbi:hypothetical protein QUW41_06965 [Slackia piriformis]|nr:hypothetical protein [Slackia piriformis]